MRQIARDKFFTKIIFLTWILSALFVRAEAQVTITGSIQDEQQTAIPAATILLLNPQDSSMVKGTITDDSGHFRFQSVNPGFYLLSISVIGFQNRVTSPFEAGNGTMQMDPITLLQSVELMDAIAVSARRPMFEQELDRLIFNVQQNISSAGSSVLEMLGKSPGVQINKQNSSISLNGTPGVRILINDKDTRMPADAVLEMLDGMNAANVEQIELIHTPPARYEAEGTAGIINVKMVKYTGQGYFGSTGGNLGYNRAETLGGHLNFTYRGRKIGFFTNYSINYDRKEELWRNERFLEQQGFMESVITSNMRNPTIDVQNLQAGLEYRIQPETEVSLLLTGSRRLWKTNDLSENNIFAGPDFTLASEMSVRETNNWKNGNANLGFTHAFNENRNIGIDLDYLYYVQDNPSVYQNDFLGGNEALMEIEGIDVDKRTPIHIRSARVDYSEQISPGFGIETGIKGTLSTFNNRVQVSEDSREGWHVNDALSNDVDLRETMAAVYVSSNWVSADDFQVTGGVRYEYTNSRLNPVSQQSDISRKFSHVFPSLFIKKNLGTDSSIGGSFSRRITRPTFNDLAPFVFFLSPGTFISGNTDLKPAVSNGGKLDYQHSSWLFSLQYTYTKDYIGGFQSQINTETNELIYRAQNLDYMQTASVSAIIPLEPTSWWAIQTNLAVRHQWYKTGFDYFDERESVTGVSGDMTHTIHFPNSFSFELAGYYTSSSLWGINQFRPHGVLNAGVQKTVADGNGTLRLAFNNILQSNKMMADSRMPEEGLRTKFSYDYLDRSVNLTFTWRFGNDNLDAVAIESGSEEEQRRVNAN